MMNFSNETINQVVNTINENMSDIKAMQTMSLEISVEDAAQDLLIQKYGLAQIEAEEIVEDLKKGISEFDSQISTVRTNGELPIQENLSKLSEGMDDETRHGYYTNILTALQILSNDEKNNNSIEQTLSANKQMSVDELVSEIEKAMTEGFSLDAIGNSAKKDLNPEVLSNLASKIEMNKDEFKFNTALCLYILQRDGKLKLTESEIGLPATTVGTLATAGIETILTTNELAQGTITLETWQVIMKWILGSVVFASLLVLSVTFVCYAGLSFLAILLDLFGTSLLALLVSVVLTIMATWGWSDVMSEFHEIVLEWLSNIYDKYIVVVTQKIKSLCAKIKDMILKAKEIVKEKVTSAAESIAIATTSTTAESEVQPVMA